MIRRRFLAALGLAPLVAPTLAKAGLISASGSRFATFEQMARQEGLLVAEPAGRIPPDYIPACWRNITPVDPETGCAGISFETAAGVVRLRLDGSGLTAVRDVIDEQRGYHQRRNSQSDRSSGGERSDVFIPDEVLK